MTNTQHILHRTLDIGSGLILSIIIQIVVFPWFNIFIDVWAMFHLALIFTVCLLYTSPSPRDPKTSRMPSSA